MTLQRACLRHTLSESGVVLSLMRDGTPFASATVSDSEARRFAWGLLADLEPEPPRKAAFQRTLDAQEMKLCRALGLSPAESALALVLYRAGGAFLPRPEIMSRLYPGAVEPPGPKILDVWLSHFRRKVGDGLTISDRRQQGIAMTPAGLKRVKKALGGFA